MLISLLNAVDFPSWISATIYDPGKPGGIALGWYGLAYIVGIYGAYYYALRMTKRRDIWVPTDEARSAEVVPTENMLSDLMIYCLIGIIIGGRLGYIILYSPETFLTPINILKTWEGGMSFHGGFLGVVAACAFASWKFKIDKFRIGDMASIGAPIGLGMVRFFGNFFNQELWGRETDVPWGMVFPKDPQLMVRHPSQLYETFLEGILLFFILRFMMIRYKALTKPGLLFGALTFFYGLFRFSVEFVREPDALAQFGGFGEFIFTRGMAYSLPMIIVGAILMLWAKKRTPVSPKHIAKEADD